MPSSSSLLLHCTATTITTVTCLLSLVLLLVPPSGCSSESERLALPRADWVALAQGNMSALALSAFQQARQADQGTQAKVERIEKMLNSSLQHNAQSAKSGAEVLNSRLAREEPSDHKNGASAVAIAKITFIRTVEWLFPTLLVAPFARL